jgi:acetoin utilization deacetylase AcuC-like enzyme
MIGDCTIPTLFVLEGGYAVGEIGVNVVNVLTGFETMTPGRMSHRPV